MERARSVSALLFSAVAAGCFAAGCFHATPVTPAPASAQEVEAIVAALRSRSWESRRWRADDGEWREDVQPTQFVFTERRATITPVGGMSMCDKCEYVLDGRNIRVTAQSGTVFTFRVDTRAPDHLELFWYDVSRHLDLTIVGARPSRD